MICYLIKFSFYSQHYYQDSSGHKNTYWHMLYLSSSILNFYKNWWNYESVILLTVKILILKIIWLSNHSILRLSDDGYSRNASWTLNKIFDIYFFITNNSRLDHYWGYWILYQLYVLQNVHQIFYKPFIWKQNVLWMKICYTSIQVSMY